MGSIGFLNKFIERFRLEVPQVSSDRIFHEDIEKSIKFIQNLKLDNDDLANILNINSVKMPIHKRLKKDFKKARFHKDPSMYNVYLDDFRSPPLQPIQPEMKSDSFKTISLETVFTSKLIV